MPHAIDLSIIIVNYNGDGYLLACVASIFDTITNIGFEVIVFDNASSDESISNLSSRFPGVKIIKSQHNLGFARANNIAISTSRGKYILLLNPDIVLAQNTVVHLVGILDSEFDIGMTGPTLVRVDGTLDHACRRMFPNRFDYLARLYWLDRLFPGSPKVAHYALSYWEREISCDVDCISGAFMLVRRQAFAYVGLLDERFFLYAEDVDWAYRFVMSGWRVYYCADVLALHFKHKSAASCAPLAIREFYNSTLLFFDKYHSKSGTRFTNLVVRVLIMARMYLSLTVWYIWRRWI